MMLIRRPVWLLVAVGLLACLGCQSSKPPQSLCGDMPAAWFAEATGEKGLESSVEVERGSTQSLPLRWDAQHPFEASDIKCRVMNGDDELVEFSAELRPADELGFYQETVNGAPAANRFTAAGGNGSLLAAGPEVVKVDVFWLCGSSSVGLTIRKFASDDRAGIAKQLTTRIAERVGCTQTYTRPGT